MPAARFPRVCSCAAACLFVTLSANAGQTSSLSYYQHAEELHQALESQPEAQRTRRDYERVLDAYRIVYHSDPASAKADASINTVADLLAEEGLIFHSQKAFRDAIGQYEFLRRQYPYSRYRFAALIAEGEIYRFNLADRDQAKAEFEEFLRTYPKHPLAEQARAALADIRTEEALNEPVRRRDSTQAAALPESTATMEPADTESTPADAGLAAASKTAAAQAKAAKTPRALPAPEEATDSSPSDEPAEDQPETRDRLPRVTGIRYWVGASDTRIAIDLEDQVTYGAAQIAHPNRVYFDLRGTRLAPMFKGRVIAVSNDAVLTRIRAAQFSNSVTRIVLDTGPGVDYSAFFLPNPWRLIIDIHDHKTGATPPLVEADNQPPVSPPQTASMPKTPSEGAGIQGSRTTAQPTAAAASRPTSSRNAHAHPDNQLESLTPPPVSSGAGPTTPVQKTSGAATLASSSTAGNTESAPYGEEFPPARDTGPTSDRERSLSRTLGLKVGRIVIDPGHGGHDCGTLGPGGIEEKDVTLDVALRLGRLLKDRLGADVIYTRRDDTFIPLETRTAIANEAHADLFISIHANSSSDPEARGVESYYLNFTTAPDALEVAARENATSNESVSDLSNLVKEIALKDKIEESRAFAIDVQRALYNGLEAGNPGLKNRGVKKAPFVVLIGANMPSILAEISFLTNPDDARELRQPAYRQRIAEALYRGVARYINEVNGVRLAENGVRPGN